jgi:precorrin-6A synthase
MRRILVIGIGAGDPEQITVQAVKALNCVDVVLVMDKGQCKDDLVQLRRSICERYVTDRPYRIVEISDPERDRANCDYEAAVLDWHQRRAELLERTILAEVPEDGCGAFLVWGDPALYDSTIRVVERILDRGVVAFDWVVIPGVTSVQALAARHRVTLNRVGGSIHVTTGRRLSCDPRVGPEETVVVMLDGDLACRVIEDPDVEIFWGADVGTPYEVLRSGRLIDVIGDIEQARAETRQRKGWVMDTYLLRRMTSG